MFVLPEPWRYLRWSPCVQCRQSHAGLTEHGGRVPLPSSLSFFVCQPCCSIALTVVRAVCDRAHAYALHGFELSPCLHEAYIMVSAAKQTLWSSS